MFLCIQQQRKTGVASSHQESSRVGHQDHASGSVMEAYRVRLRLSDQLQFILRAEGVETPMFDSEAAATEIEDGL